MERRVGKEEEKKRRKVVEKNAWDRCRGRRCGVSLAYLGYAYRGVVSGGCVSRGLHGQ